jgi:hypothetical protein
VRACWSDDMWIFSSPVGESSAGSSAPRQFEEDLEREVHHGPPWCFAIRIVPAR